MVATYYSQSKGQTVDMAQMHPSHLVNALNKQLREAAAIKTRLATLDNEAEAFYTNPDNQGMEYYYGEQERAELRNVELQIGKLATELASRGFVLEARLERSN
jgi:hypothetical protein